jgi:NADH-quinone oxidoreductase subunit K
MTPEQIATAAQLHNALLIGAALFVLGTVGFLTRRNLIVMFLSVELMLQAVALNLIAFGNAYSNYHGQSFTIFVLTVAACEAAIALVLFLAIYQQRKTLDVSVWHDLGEIDICTEEPDLAKEAMLADPVPEQDIPVLTPAGREPNLSVNGEPVKESVREGVTNRV